MGIQVFKGAAKQRARLVGQRNQLIERSAANAARVAELETQIRAYNLVLRSQDIDIDPDDFRPAVPHEHSRNFKHGQRIALCLDALRAAKRPLSTLEIFDYVVAHVGLRFTSPAARRAARRGVNSQLWLYAQRGIVARVTDPKARHDDVAYWTLPATYPKTITTKTTVAPTDKATLSGL